MLSYDMTARGDMPLYEFLYRQIREDIHRGTLKAGYKLPSRRSLAGNLGISVITVENAYDQLLSEGYIQAEPRRGYFVADLPGGMRAQEPCKVRIPEAAEPKPLPLLADFASNETPAEQFPFVQWSRLIRELLSMNREDLMKNPPAGGRLDLRRAIAGHLQAYRALTVDPEQIIVGAGTEYLYGLLSQLLGLDRVWAVEEPGYQKAASVYRSHGAVCRPVLMDEDGIRVEGLLEAGADVAHVSPSHHYPTGRVMSAARRYELLAWAEQGERYIIEDDYDSEFRLSGLPIPALQSMDRSGRVIYMNTFTKTLSSTIRISYMVLPAALMRRYREKLSFYACTVSNIEQATLAAFISRGYFEKHLNRTRSLCRRKRDLLLRNIRSTMPSAVISEEDAGLHFLLQIRTELTDDRVCALAREHGVRLAPLSAYYHTEARPSHCFVINYSSLREEEIGPVCAALARVEAETGHLRGAEDPCEQGVGPV